MGDPYDRPHHQGGQPRPAQGSGDDIGQRKDRPRATAWQASLELATVGVELAGVVGGFTALGYLLDYWLGLFPMFMLIGAVVGIGGGLYRAIRKAMKH